MNLWLFGLLVCFVVSWAPAVHTQGVFEDCCLAYQHRLRWSMRRQVKGYRIQDVSGGCNLPAVIFLIHKKNSSSLIMKCANPQDEWVKDWVMFLHDKNDAHPKPCLHHWRAHSATCARLMSNPSMNRTRTSPR